MNGCGGIKMVPRGGINPIRAPGPRSGSAPGVRDRHRHEDFQSGLYFYTLIKSVTYALPFSICASKWQ